MLDSRRFPSQSYGSQRWGTGSLQHTGLLGEEYSLAEDRG